MVREMVKIPRLNSAALGHAVGFMPRVLTFGSREIMKIPRVNSAALGHAVGFMPRVLNFGSREMVKIPRVNSAALGHAYRRLVLRLFVPQRIKVIALLIALRLGKRHVFYRIRIFGF